MQNLAFPTDGVSVWSDGVTRYVSVDNFGAQAQELLRARIAEICWGPTALHGADRSLSYKATMRSFWKRIKNKPTKTKVGMIGELITHLFLTGDGAQYSSVNRLFNLEEASIKKGFDLVIRDIASSEIYFVEVKSSAVASKKSTSKLTRLLKVADKDISGKLNAPADNLWDNALAHCSSALRKTDLRDRIEDIIAAFKDDAYEVPSSETHHVILSAVSFNRAAGYCTPQAYELARKAVKKWGIYKSLTYFVAQKKTYEAIIDFIEKEAA